MLNFASCFNTYNFIILNSLIMLIVQASVREDRGLLLRKVRHIITTVI